MISQIRAYYQATEHIATSGQPTEQQFSEISDAGYTVVINLALPTSTHAIAHESEVVGSLGLSYIHIPVSWENPQLADVQQFFSAMKLVEGQKIWVHCALNMRVSCFMYLYKKYVLQLPEPQALFPMSAIWQPTGAWEKLINDAKEL